MDQNATSVQRHPDSIPRDGQVPREPFSDMPTYREFGGAKDFAIGIHRSVQGRPLLSLPVAVSGNVYLPRSTAAARWFAAVKAKATQEDVLLRTPGPGPRN
jgi:hypothetical protein